MRFAGKWSFSVGILSLAWCVAGPARASVVLQLSFEELAARSTRIVVGDVTSVEPRWAEDGQRIETVVDVAVDTDLSNASYGATARLVQPGGQIGDRGMAVSGTPQFHKGERVLLFLRASGSDRDGTPAYSVVGMAQGKFVVVARADGGWYAVQDLPGTMAFMAPGADGALELREPDGPLVLDLDEAMARIRAVRGEVTP
jgi:hypothetical protein